MNTILHDPTRGWLLLTEKWPEKHPNPMFNNEQEYNAVIRSCLSTAIEIDPESMQELLKDHNSPMEPQDHHPYSVDAEFEVKMQKRKVNTEQWIDMSVGERDTVLMNYAYRQIARLVKAKEEKKPCGLDYYQIRNGQCKHGETGGHNGDVICDVCQPTQTQPTESQDELWDEALRKLPQTWNDLKRELKKRFVISRKAPDQF